jgi:hypothetical protein
MLIQNARCDNEIALSPSASVNGGNRPSTTLLKTPFRRLTQFQSNNRSICREALPNVESGNANVSSTRW